VLIKFTFGAIVFLDDKLFVSTQKKKKGSKMALSLSLGDAVGTKKAWYTKRKFQWQVIENYYHSHINDPKTD
jgi:hypothetical protein